MYRIEETSYGYRLTFTGRMDADEMNRWLEESQQRLARREGSFVVFVDMCGLRLLGERAKQAMAKGQRLYLDRGMERSVVILDDTLLTMQFRRIAWESGIHRWERYVDASITPDAERIGLAWILDGVDPDLQPSTR